MLLFRLNLGERYNSDRGREEFADSLLATTRLVGWKHQPDAMLALMIPAPAGHKRLAIGSAP